MRLEVLLSRQSCTKSWCEHAIQVQDDTAYCKRLRGYHTYGALVSESMPVPAFCCPRGDGYIRSWAVAHLMEDIFNYISRTNGSPRVELSKPNMEYEDTVLKVAKHMLSEYEGRKRR